MRAGAQVHPLAGVTVTEETLVVLVAVALHDAGLDLAADATMRPEGGAGTDLGTQDMAVRPDMTGAFQPGERRYGGTAVNDDRPARRVRHHHRLEVSRRRQPQPFARPDHRHPRLHVSARDGVVLEVTDDLRPIEIDKIPEMANHAAADAALRQGIPPAFEALVDRGSRALVQMLAAEDGESDLIAGGRHAGPIEVVGSARRRQPAAVDQHGRAGPQRRRHGGRVRPRAASGRA